MAGVEQYTEEKSKLFHIERERLPLVTSLGKSLSSAKSRSAYPKAQAVAMSFAGLDIAYEGVSDLEIEDDVDGERNVQSPETWNNIIQSPESCTSGNLPGDDDMEEAVIRNSKEVSDGTDNEYRRLMATFDKWLVTNGYIPSGKTVFGTNVPPNTPLLICVWIMTYCDSINPDGSEKPSTQYRRTYAYAMKMRSALTYGFGRVYSRGNQPWSSPDGTHWEGNPSVSTPVSRYMVALRKRKHKNGESAMSSRAITSSVIKELYDFNNQPQHRTIREYQPMQRKDNNLDNWGGPRARLLVHAVVTIAFCCLLRIDEALNLQASDITIESTECISITLPFRKTDPYGGIKPFILWRLEEDENHLCPVCALAAWIQASQIKDGFLFRSLASGDRVSSHNSPITSAQFLELFRNNLLDIGKDPFAYGTHSLRRGGCQWLARERRWPISRICDWAGWALDFSHLTIVKYLLSWNDDPHEPREDFFNPKRAPTVHCPRCGRNCWHA